MRGTTTILIVSLSAIAVLALYFFLIKPRVDERYNELKASQTAEEARQIELARMQTEIPKMREKLPEWRMRLGLYRKAIPQNIEDDVFLANLQQQIERHGVELMRLDVNRSGRWLRDLDEKSKETLRGMGVDVEMAQQIEVAFYSITLNGDYKEVISTLEDLKRYGRLYSIEQVTAPAGGAGGAILASDNPERVPLQVTGSIFFGVPEDYMNSEQLYENFMRSLISPLAGTAYGGIRKSGKAVLNERENSRPGGSASGQGGNRGRVNNNQPAGQAGGTDQ